MFFEAHKKESGSWSATLLEISYVSSDQMDQFQSDSVKKKKKEKKVKYDRSFTFEIKNDQR